VTQLQQIVSNVSTPLRAGMRSIRVFTFSCFHIFVFSHFHKKKKGVFLGLGLGLGKE